jgi:hypothetical protein
MLRTRTARLLIAVAAVFVVTAGAAYATGGLGSIVGSDGVIHGCYQKFNGDLHLVAADATQCSSGQLPIAWNQTGPKGEKGDPGAKGDAGPQGIQGARGTAGANGVSGYEIGGDTFTVTAGDALTLARVCPTGKVVVGGGAWLFTNGLADTVTPHIVQSAPIDTHTWEIKIDAGATVRNWDYRFQIICVTAS